MTGLSICRLKIAAYHRPLSLLKNKLENIDQGVKHLPEGHDNVNVTFFAEGSFNKLYSVSSPHIPQHYLIRVALPVDPFFKQRMSFEVKASLTTEICGYLESLQGLQFTQIGSLYFSSVREPVGTRDIGDALEAIPTNTTVDCGIGTDFVIGRVVSPWFFRDKRLYLSAVRGPFQSSYQFMMAKTRM
ncbi:hypothetical protein BDV27DRAFT_142671 [Aspergillus caelatus]|uniref:Inositol-pentakisphosphate 2-kinase n=1 Tax=Aspergillus caelatus TaxID=61420 RepID=A0A5N7ACD2_9EURO|nr:uncharacterized protein BDV27DRAFT_142671 [Aspergillus caelatus]KAE8367514.1 hypothetical protein BDV27DRAFT_142671 [Aspergillus caelatus]